MILIVADDRSAAASLSLLLKHSGDPSGTVATPPEAMAYLRKQPYQLVIQDLSASRGSSHAESLDLLGRIRDLPVAIPVVLITGRGAIDLAVEGMKAGAADFVTKPWTNQQLLRVVETALGVAGSRPPADTTPTRDELDRQFDFGGLVGSDPRLLRVLQVAGRIASTDAPVLITGESGTGKELLAEAIHKNSRRFGRPFVTVNLGRITSTQFEHEMFGHVRSMPPDGRAERKGRIESADRGTIFLDEIGDLDPASQVRLLRVLEDGAFEVPGSGERRGVDVRAISATHRNLAQMAASGEFREDLLYRINLIALHLPPLRERPGDIPILATRFLHALGERYGREPLVLGPAARRWLETQPWPGNIRQLRQSIERAVLVSTSEVLGAEDFREVENFCGASAIEPRTGGDALPAVGSMTIDEIERAMIVKSLKHHAGNVSRVAESLGLSRAALYRRFEKYAIPV